MNVALFALAIPVCIADMSNFVIPNIYSKILFYAALIHLGMYGFGQSREILLSLVVLVMLLIVGTGMGDIKILVLILFTHNFDTVQFIAYVFLLAMVHIVILAAVHRTMPAKIALAPSIFIGLATYLAAR